MSDQPQKPRRRWRWLIVTVIVTAIGAYIGWSNHTWHDPRFVGAWRVVNSKSPHQSIWVLNAHGSGSWQEWTGSDWWMRRSNYHWSISRRGFLFDDLPNKPSQALAYVTSLGGLATDGKLRPLYL